MRESLINLFGSVIFKLNREIEVPCELYKMPGLIARRPETLEGAAVRVYGERLLVM